MANKEGKCEICSVYRKWLHPHHLKPRTLGGTDQDGIKYICANCHEDFHEGVFGGKNLRGRLCHSPEAQKKRSRFHRLLWTDPEYREMQKNSRIKSWEGNPNRRKRVSDGIKEYRKNATAEQNTLHNLSISIVKKCKKLGIICWSAFTNSCLRCGKNERPHIGNGFCDRCYGKVKQEEKLSIQEVVIEII